MIYLLDSNAWIAYLRGKDANLLRHLNSNPPSALVLCSVVLGELLYGANHSGLAHKTANLNLISNLRQRFKSLPFDDQAAEEYGKLRAHLASFGTPIGPNDVMIAAIALANGLTEPLPSCAALKGLNRAGAYLVPTTRWMRLRSRGKSGLAGSRSISRQTAGSAG